MPANKSVDAQSGPASGVDVRAEQPRPDRALVVGAVPLGRTAPVPADDTPGRVRGEAARPERGEQRRRAIRRSVGSSGSSGAYGSDQASSWLGRSRSSSWRGPAQRVRRRRRVHHVVQPAGRRREPVAERCAARSCSRRSSSASGPASSVSSARPASPLTHSALTSTGLPVRGVTGTPSPGRPSRSAPRPAAPWVSSPSAGSTRDAVPGAGQVRVDHAAQRGQQLVAEVGVAGDGDVPARPRAGTTASRRRCCTPTRPVSAVLASMPSDSVAAYARSSSRPSSARPVPRNSPSYEIIVSRDQAPNHG